MSDTSRADTFAAKVAEAQADLRHGIDRAGLRDDPLRHVLAGLADTVQLFPGLVREIGSAIERARQPVDAEAFEQAVRRLERSAARGADLQSARLVRVHARRTALVSGLVLVLGIAAAAGGGWRRLPVGPGHGPCSHTADRATPDLGVPEWPGDGCGLGQPDAVE